MGIDILVPVLNRPSNASKVAESAKVTREPYRLWFICSPLDHAQIEACKQTDAEILVVDWQPRSGDYARKINWGFSQTDWAWVFQGADDLIFHPGWDIEALKVEKRVIGTNDLHNPTVKRGKSSTHTLIARGYVNERPATVDESDLVLFEGYDHQYVDRELCEVAMRRGEWGFARESHVEHLHPALGAREARFDVQEGHAPGNGRPAPLSRPHGLPTGENPPGAKAGAPEGVERVIHSCA